MMSLPDQIGNWMLRSHLPRGASSIAIPQSAPRSPKAANFDVVIQEAIAGHHERMDGSGYPNGASGARIPLEARIIAVCEVFDSMTRRHVSRSWKDDGSGHRRDQAGRRDFV